MSTVVFLAGVTAADVLRGLGRSFGPLFEQHGYEFIEIGLDRPDAMTILGKIVNEKRLEFVFSFLSMGADIQTVTDDGSKRNLWEAAGVPFISLSGDSPAYFFDRHVHASRLVGTLYGFPEHLAFRKRLPKCHGLIGLSKPVACDITEFNAIDFKKKVQGKLFFPKNGNDPQKLLSIWRGSLPPRIVAMLSDLAFELEGKIDTSTGDDIDAFVCSYFKAKNLDVDGLTRLRLFFNAQLDDYLRRVKSTMMAEVLMDFPVEIHGYNWDHLDFSGKRCTFVGGGDYARSRDIIKNALGVIDMSPNTGLAPHDRPLRAFGMYTLCLTNEQSYFRDAFPNYREFSFQFNEDSLRDKISDVLARPSYYAELGIDVAQQFRDANPPENAVTTMIDAASLLRMEASPRPENMQNFLIWPPSSI